MASSKLLTKAEAEAALRARDWKEDPLKRLPPDVNPSLAAEVALELLANRVWPFARQCQRLPAPVVREVLRRLTAENSTEPVKVFLREALRLSTGPVVEAWAGALLALLDLDSEYVWGSKQKRAKFAALAANPQLLAALQAAVVATPTPPMAMLAVLAADGSEASADALLATFAQAKVADDRLAKLATHAAKTPAMAALLTSAESRSAAKSKASPAILFAREQLGLEVEVLSVHVTVGSVELNANNVPRYQGSFDVDSKWDQYWAIGLSSVGTDATIRSTHVRMGAVVRDDLKLGGCELVDAPRWFAAAAKKLGVSLRAGSQRGSLRGKKRELVAKWLFPE